MSTPYKEKFHYRIANSAEGESGGGSGEKIGGAESLF